jgi:predicted metalloendopeptidase
MLDKALILGLTSAMVAACASAPAPRATAPASPPAAPATAPAPVLKSGLDLPGFDRSVRPQDDLYRFAGGGWLARTEIPADRSNYGAFSLLQDDAEANIRQLVDEAARRTDHVRGTDAQKIGDLYRSFMDEARLESLGAKPLAAELERIAAIRTRRDVVAYIGYAQRIGVAHPLAMAVYPDPGDSSRYIAALQQSGLSMPDRDYYLKPEERFREYRAALETYVERLLALGGVPQAKSAAKRVVALETRIANHHWTAVRNRDPVATYTRVDLAAAIMLAPDFDWVAFFEGARAPAQPFVVRQSTYVKGLGALVKNVPVSDWRAYFQLRLLDEFAPYLAKSFADLHFDFHGRTLAGVAEQKPRWKRGIDLLDASVGQLAGKLYVERHFRPESKAHVRQLVANLLRAFDASIDELEWMTPATKREAKDKLGKFTVKVGYPDQWRDYAKLEIEPGDLAGNLLRSAAFEHARRVGRIGNPVDRTEWLMTPQTVNAYYYPPLNEIVFPAAILQPPFFDPQADDAMNYGAIGAVIGHEISHGFDDKGRKYDGAGNLRDWWTMEDNARFMQRAGKLVEQYGGYAVLDGQKLNGELTLGENIGDLSGLAVAHKAWRLSLGGGPSPVIDGFPGEQRFFLGWAQVWRRLYREDEMRKRLLTDPHAFSEFRANGAVANMDAFHEAFEAREGDRLYRAPGDRVRIW